MALVDTVVAGLFLGGAAALLLDELLSLPDLELVGAARRVRDSVPPALARV